MRTNWIYSDRHLLILIQILCLHQKHAATSIRTGCWCSTACTRRINVLVPSRNWTKIACPAYACMLQSQAFGSPCASGQGSLAKGCSMLAVVDFEGIECHYAMTCRGALSAFTAGAA